MVEIGNIVPLRTPWINRPKGKVEGKQPAGHEHKNRPRGETGESQKYKSEMVEESSFDGYA